ncbi:MAG: type IV pilus secretin PilQ, partial [Mariprofundaceae bacterium]|nr:type IV pilus secretin PilQ [Mariprofundaceae bacterium]
DFPGPVKQVDAYTVDHQVRVVARLREKVEISSFQQGNVLTLTLTPKNVAVARRGLGGGEKSVYTGQKVTFDFKDIDIQNALKLIAEMSELNIIMSDDVRGKLTMHLVDVPWDQALDLILSARGLGKERSGNVMRIAPAKILQAENASRLQAQKTTQNLEPLVTEFISLSYAKVTDIETILAGARNSGTTSGTGKNAPSGNLGLSSTRGSVLADNRTNTLIVHDTQAVINNIKRLIARIDRPQKQVLIAARIVEATDNFSRDLGVRWGGQVSGRGGKVTNQISNNTTTPGGFLVDLPAAVAAGSGGQIGLAIGALNNAFNLNLELSAAEADKKIKIISSPRLVTMDLKKATISQGQDVPFLSTSQNGTNITFKKANLSLEVTPQITAANSLLLHILVTKDSVSDSPSVAGNPIIDTKTIETDVFMDNGETIVIGGIYTRNRQNTTNAVPGLSKIPILGWLFKKNLRKDDKTELLIFLTPQILQSRPDQGKRIAAFR